MAETRPVMLTGMRSLLPAILVIGLVNCVPRGVIDDARDRDDDGHVAWQLGGDDCDDAEPTANPSEDELCGDSVDNDCDGAIDDVGTNAATWYPDLDGDGFPVDAPVVACSEPTDHRPSLDAGLDCDDEDPSVNPAATDTWYDGVDSDCDQADDYDQDGDAFRDPAGGGLDCHDLDDAIHPGATEICGNHVDDDCDGTHNLCAWAGELALDETRHATIVWAFEHVVPTQVAVGDTNLDGRDDVVLGGMESGQVFLFEGPLTGTLLTSLHADVHIDLLDPPNIFGLSPSLNDLDGDGDADLILHNCYNSELDRPVVHLVTPPFRSSMTAADITKTLYGPDPAVAPSSGFGFTGSALGDLDGDGISEFVVNQEGTEPPVCYVLEGLGSGSNPSTLATATLTHCDGGVAGIPDLDGDGIDDIGVRGTSAITLVPGDSEGSVDLLSMPSIQAWTDDVSVAPVSGVHSLDSDGLPRPHRAREPIGRAGRVGRGALRPPRRPQYRDAQAENQSARLGRLRRPARTPRR